MVRRAFLLVAVLACAVILGAEPAVKENNFEWKTIWVWGLARKTESDAAKEIAQAKSLGFNTIVLSDPSPDYRRWLIQNGHASGVKIYLGIDATYGEWGFQQEPGATLPTVDCLQAYDDLAALNNPANPDYASHPGPWLCCDRPEVRHLAVENAKSLAANYKPDGIALDWVGYKNHRGCMCRYSRQERAKFAAAHPELSKEEVEKQFSLQNLIALYQEVHAALQAEHPQVKLACHVYPQFELEPLYGNRLPVEYPAQTVAWFFKPHWPLAQVADNCRTVKATEKKHHDFVTGVGFIGLDMEEKSVKTPERLRAEIRAIKESGLSAICVAGGAEFLREAPLASVMSEELGGTFSGK